MSTRRTCDVCGFDRRKTDGSSSVLRYGLSRQVPVPGITRGGRPHAQAFKRERSFGGIDLCGECFDRIAKPKMRPELRGRTGPKAKEVEVA